MNEKRFVVFNKRNTIFAPLTITKLKKT